LTEEELALFDLLTKPDPKLTKKQEVEVKKVAQGLLTKLKREKLVLDWRKKQQTARPCGSASSRNWTTFPRSTTGPYTSASATSPTATSMTATSVRAEHLREGGLTESGCWPWGSMMHEFQLPAVLAKYTPPENRRTALAVVLMPLQQALLGAFRPYLAEVQLSGSYAKAPLFLVPPTLTCSSHSATTAAATCRSCIR